MATHLKYKILGGLEQTTKNVLQEPLNHKHKNKIRE